MKADILQSSLALLAAGVLAHSAGCSKSDSETNALARESRASDGVRNQGALSTPTKDSASLQVDATTQQALDEAEAHFLKHWTARGDSFFIHIAEGGLQGFHELTGVTSGLRKVKLTEADKLNKVEWIGSVDFYGKARRQTNAEGVWELWKEVRGVFYSVNLKNQDGTWTARASSGYYEDEYTTKPTLSNLPN